MEKEFIQDLENEVGVPKVNDDQKRLFFLDKLVFYSNDLLKFTWMS